MATVNKNFKVKHGLVVEGTTGTINGENILTESQDSQDFILDLIGGETLVKSVSNEFDVSGAGELSIDRTTVDAYYDASGAATAAQEAAEDYADGLAVNYDAAGSAAAAQTAAESYADGLAVNYDPAGAAAAAQTAAEGYADQAVADLVASAPETLDTLNELAAALQDNPDIISDLQDIAAGKQDTLTAGDNIDITGATISVTGLDTDDVSEGTNLYFTDTRAKESAADLITNAIKTNITITGDENGLTITAENGVADSTTTDLAEGTNLYFTDYRARTAIIPGVGVSLNTATGYIDANLGTGLETDGSNQIQIDRTDVDTWYDANGAAAAAQTAAEGYADGLAGNYEVAGAAAAAQTAAESYADGLAVNYDAAGSAAAAESDANSYTDSLIGDVTVDGTSGNTVTARIASAVSNLVDSAPATLDTLNELAAALQDNPDIISDLQDIASGKQDTLAAGANIDITGDTISVTGLDTDDVSEGTNLYFTDARAVDALEAVVPNFTEVDINSVATQVAATGSATAATANTVYSFAKADYRSAKFLVKVASGTHTEISEVLLTLDTSDNVAITEYAIVGTNGTLSAVSAAVSGANVNLLVTPTNTSTVTVMGTLLA
jgi:hypothetical protein